MMVPAGVMLLLPESAVALVLVVPVPLKLMVPWLGPDVTVQVSVWLLSVSLTERLVARLVLVVSCASVTLVVLLPRKVGAVLDEKATSLITIEEMAR